MSQISQEFQDSGGDETGEAISLEVTSTSSHNKKSPVSAQNEETDNPTDDETPLLSNIDFTSRSISVEDEYLSSTEYEDLKKPEGGGTLFSSFLNMANSIIGAGVSSSVGLSVSSFCADTGDFLLCEEVEVTSSDIASPVSPPPLSWNSCEI
ncbi:hypothetical protein Glove_134g50 [Diversispora epigaea]|uniref:Uncharacterized protein n=1 Tax=Diversispora epigaea TaxID=1348612 RepID=A0A397J5S5_9GLOM|nr:hypothetical protein Glove_134g50 [Diversispora epigaea]